nr:ATP-binding protein [Achromobacter ruhlandii]
MVGPRARRQGVALQRPPVEQDYLVQANRIRLEQVLVNLLQNGLDALEGQADGRIIIAVQDLGASVQLFVNDNGPGLSPQASARLFTPFHTTKAEGLGLGLVISRDIIAEFGGDLRDAHPGAAVFPAPHGPGRGPTFTPTLRQSPPSTRDPRP